MKDIISSLQNKRLVWQASDKPLSASCSIRTGFSELDEALGGGWPQVGVVAIQSLVGIGELRILLPGLKLRCQQTARLLVIITPPWQINAEMFCDYGFDLHNIIMLQVKERLSQLWSAEQCLKSGCCAAVLLWHEHLQVHQVKRLQLAAQQGDALTVVFSHKQKYQGLPLSLSLDLFALSQGLEVTIKKRRGGWPLAPFNLNMSQQWPRLTQSNERGDALEPLHKASV